MVDFCGLVLNCTAVASLAEGEIREGEYNSQNFGFGASKSFNKEEGVASEVVVSVGPCHYRQWVGTDERKMAGAIVFCGMAWV